MPRWTKLTPTRRRVVLEAIAAGWSIAYAAGAAGLARQTIYAHLKDDPAFQADYAVALEAGTCALEDEARRRAMTSSDSLLMFLLRARRPGVYREFHRHELANAPDAPLTFTIAVTHPLEDVADGLAAAVDGAANGASWGAR